MARDINFGFDQPDFFKGEDVGNANDERIITIATGLTDKVDALVEVGQDPDVAEETVVLAAIKATLLK